MEDQVITIVITVPVNTQALKDNKKTMKDIAHELALYTETTDYQLIIARDHTKDNPSLPILDIDKAIMRVGIKE